jgi:hypothetical protein
MKQSWLLLALFLAGMGVICRTEARADEFAAQSAYKLKRALEDLIETHRSAYPKGPQYLKRLDPLLPALKPGSHQTREKLETLRREALLANPALLQLPGILVVQRKPKDPRSPAVMTAEDDRIGDSAGRARDIAMAILFQEEMRTGTRPAGELLQQRWQSIERLKRWDGYHAERT